MKVHHLSYDSPVGNLVISVTDAGVCGLQYLNLHVTGDHPLLWETRKQLDEYFAGERKVFDLPLYIEGTSFQEKVWNALIGIPYGEVRTYGDIAVSVGNPKGSRAVGGANNKNRIAIVIPCHRVVASNGIGGYAPGLVPKEWLLEHERKFKELKN